MADDESVSHLMVFQVGTTVMMLKISQNYQIHQSKQFFFLDDLNHPFESSDFNLSKYLLTCDDQMFSLDDLCGV